MKFIFSLQNLYVLTLIKEFCRNKFFNKFIIVNSDKNILFSKTKIDIFNKIIKNGI